MQRRNPTFNIIDITELTGGYEAESGAFAFYGQVLESLAQTTHQGTGGEPLWAEAMQTMASASGAYIVVQGPPPTVLPVDPAAVTATDIGRQLAFARHYLSLNTTDLSRILLVERPTVYAWLDGKWDPKQENKGRIRKLYQVARAWKETLASWITLFATRSKRQQSTVFSRSSGNWPIRRRRRSGHVASARLLNSVGLSRFRRLRKVSGLTKLLGFERG
jgi:hypothetical protein